MRKLTLLLAAGSLWLFLAAVPVFADGGPHVSSANSGVSTLAADGCAGCHRAHTAQGEMLINAPTEEELCLTCHGAASTGATTDVMTGIQYAIGAGGAPRGAQLGALRGGGFDQARMDAGNMTRLAYLRSCDRRVAAPEGGGRCGRGRHVGPHRDDRQRPDPARTWRGAMVRPAPAPDRRPTSLRVLPQPARERAVPHPQRAFARTRDPRDVDRQHPRIVRRRVAAIPAVRAVPRAGYPGIHGRQHLHGHVARPPGGRRDHHRWQQHACQINGTCFVQSVGSRPHRAGHAATNNFSDLRHLGGATSTSPPTARAARSPGPAAFRSRTRRFRRPATPATTPSCR